MALKTAFTIGLAFAAVYPLQFWVLSQREIIDTIKKFHIALPNVIGGLVLIAIWIMNVPLSLKLVVTGWKATLLSVSSYSWKRVRPNPWLMTVASAMGCYALLRVKSYFGGPGWGFICLGVMTGLIISWIGVFYKYRHMPIK